MSPPFRRVNSLPAGRVVFGFCLLAAIFQSTAVVSAQDALMYTRADEIAVETNHLDLESLPFTIKSGDFRLLVTPSMEADWNDNVTLVKQNPVQDYILRPMLTFDGTYPITDQNLLQFRIGAGYDFYLEHKEFSALRLESGSQISFDTFIKNFRFNLHERFQYIEDPASQASFAASGRYAGLDNTAGLSAVWYLQDLALTVDYDHRNFASSTGEFDYLDLASELILARVGFRVVPTLTNGVEAGGSFTTYDQNIFNNNNSYNVGAFADWRPGSYFELQARSGYTTYFFQQSSRTVEAFNQYSVYGALSAIHEITERLSYAIDAGHEVRLAQQADFIKDWYVRSRVDWAVIKGLKFSPNLSFENGKQGQSNPQGTLAENYDWVATGFTLRQVITKNLTAMLSYRLTLRASSVASRGYTQDFVGINVAYQFN
ncbi:MAG: hypothetical protein ACLQVY_08865 [Limisphaerales bacterium]